MLRPDTEDTTVHTRFQTGDRPFNRSLSYLELEVFRSPGVTSTGKRELHRTELTLFIVNTIYDHKIVEFHFTTMAGGKETSDSVF